MGTNEKFKAKKSKKKKLTKRETVGHVDDRLQDLAVPLVQVGLAMLFIAFVLWILTNFVL
jgi:hypothetical protein